MNRTLIDITPSKYRCVMSPACPAIFKSEQDNYVIIGKTVDPNKQPILRGRVAEYESAIEVPVGLVEGAVFGVSRS